MTDPQQQRYTLQKELGAGTMGTVWLATDTLLNRLVAIKYLRAVQNTEHKDFFLSEARTLASLNHPNITLLYDAVFDEQQQQFYLVMEYIEGQPLSHMIKGWSGSLPLNVIIEVAIGVLQALQYAHSKGIVHRDIKPENVIFQKEGVKLTDFGLANLVPLLEKQKGSFMVGTPAYMSPEQIEGMPINGRSDLYSLGVMLFEMLSGGHKPFEQFTRISELFNAHLKKAPPPLRVISPEVPLALERTVMRLMAKEPADRYPSAHVVIDILHSIQARQRFSQLHLNLLDLEIKPLVGRDKELEQLAQIWEQSQKFAKPHLVVVQGEMGLGKTCLVAEFLGHSVINKGFVALMGRCDRSGTPYTPFAEILGAILNKELSATVLSSEQIDYFLKYIPDLARLFDIPHKAATLEILTEETGSIILPTDTQRWRFFAAVLDTLTELGPTVLFLEDADFLDEASAVLSQYLLRRGQFPLLLIATSQQNKPTWLSNFSSDERTFISLAPLSKKAIEEKLIDLIGGTLPEMVLDLVEQRSQGNPLQIEEIVRQLLDAKTLRRDEAGQWRYIPPQKKSSALETSQFETISRSSARQIEDLSEMSRDALTVAALIEPNAEFDFDLWLELLGGKSQLELAQRAVDEGLYKRFLRQLSEGRYTLRPPEIVRRLVMSLPEIAQRDLHEQIAAVLHKHQRDPLLIAYHYEQAGLLTKAADYLEKAGAEAAKKGTVKLALIYFKRAVTFVESYTAYKTLGRLYRQEKEWSDSLQALQYALELAEEAENVVDQAETLNELSQTLWLYDDYEEAYEPAAAVLEMEGVLTSQQAVAHSNLSMITWLMGRLSEAEQHGQQAVAALNATEMPAAVADVMYRLGLIHLSQGRLALARTDFHQAAMLYQKLHRRLDRGYALIGLGRTTIEQGEFGHALSFLEVAKQQFEAVDNQMGRVTVYTNRGRLLLHRGQPNEALPWLTKASHLALKTNLHHPYEVSDIYRLIAQTTLKQGEIQLAHSAALDALKLVQAVGNREYVILTQATLAQVYAAQGDKGKAETLYLQALQDLKESGSHLALIRTQHQYGQFLKQKGQTDEAKTIEKEIFDQARTLGLHLV